MLILTLIVRMSSGQATNVPLMIGGAKFKQAFYDWAKQSNTLFSVIFGAILILYATYADKLPSQWRWQLSTTPGRLLLVLILYILFELFGWIPALLFTIAIALTWSNRPLYKPPTSHSSEGFRGDTKVSKVEKDTKHLWFVEKVLQENPRKIVEDRVDTLPPQ